MCRKTALNQVMKHLGMVSADPIWGIRGFLSCPSTFSPSSLLPCFFLLPDLVQHLKYTVIRHGLCMSWGCPASLHHHPWRIYCCATRGAQTGRWAPQLALPPLLKCSLPVQPQSGLWLLFGGEHRFRGWDLVAACNRSLSQRSCLVSGVCTPANKLSGIIHSLEIDMSLENFHTESYNSYL